MAQALCWSSSVRRQNRFEEPNTLFLSLTFSSTLGPSIYYECKLKEFDLLSCNLQTFATNTTFWTSHQSSNYVTTIMAAKETIQ